MSFDPLETLLRRVPFFRTLDRVDAARLIGALEEVRIPAGTPVIPEGSAADALYLIESGSVSVSVQTGEGMRTVATLDGPTHVGELGLLLGRRTASVHAVTDVRAWRLPRERFEHLVRERPLVGLAVASSLAELLDRRSREHVGAPIVDSAHRPMVLAARPPIRPRIWRVIGVLLAAALPAALWSMQPPGALSSDGWRISLIVLGAALLWLFEPVPDFIAAFVMVAAWGLAGLVPLEVALTGFATSSWLVALSSLALAAAMTQSGLLFRIALVLLRIFPATHRGQVLGLLTSGLLVTPLVPLSVARIAAIAPVGHELGQALGYPPRSRATAALSLAGLTGYGYFSSVFLTGLASNFFVLGLLSAADRARFSWLGWLAGAAVAGAVMFVGAAIAIMILFPAEAPSKVTADVLARQRRVLGPLSTKERMTIVALAILIAGLLIQPLIHIDTAWLAIGALAASLAGTGLDRERFRSGIDWGFLMLFGILLGTGDVMHRAGVDRWITTGLASITRAVNIPGALLVFIAVAVAISRLVLPRIPAQLLLSLAFIPAAPALGISPWVMGFVVMIMAHTWILPNQGLEYLITRDVTRGEAFTDRQGLIAGAVLTLVRLAAISASIPFWQALGLLRP